MSQPAVAGSSEGGGGGAATGEIGVTYNVHNAAYLLDSNSDIQTTKKKCYHCTSKRSPICS